MPIHAQNRHWPWRTANQAVSSAAYGSRSMAVSSVEGRRASAHRPGSSRCSSVPKFHSNSSLLVSQAVASDAALMASA